MRQSPQSSRRFARLMNPATPKQRSIGFTADLDEK
jgi:hypothetical protein